MASYETVIGLEVHVQLNTASKMFCRCRNRFGDPPNTNVCPVCLGLPGSLPVPNRTAIEYAIKAGLTLNCDIALWSKFDRKNYYYPDLPKNYQVSQYDLPFCRGGWLATEVNGEMKRFGVTRVHLEEDAGKLMHDEFGGGSHVDLNRTGTPLLEIVSEPDMRSPDDAFAYLTTLKQLVSYLDISDCTMEEGSLRCDANISLRPIGQEKLGTKVEIKNMNSFRGVHKALSYEQKRQAAALDAGETIAQETRLFDAAIEKTRSMRSKEEAHDYRYFPDPDLVPVTFTEDQVDAWRTELPEQPKARHERFMSEFALSDYDASLLTSERPLADYFEAVVAAGAPGKVAANWVANNLLSVLNEGNTPISDCPVAPDALAEMIALIEQNALSGNSAKNDVFPEMFATGKRAAVIVEEKGLTQVSDTGQIDEWVTQALDDNPEVIESLRAGKTKATGKIVGAVMRASKGKADPRLVNARIQELIKPYLEGGE
jgi:aspartyl-tRNA(Asn)/glutamyl-tRNA(Gln) amidotransferase subunit B